jgi:transcriptional regulator with GAF, ATPase, and Fis domain
MNRDSSSEDKLRALMGGARAILEKECFNESARAIFDYCCQITGATSGYVALLSPEGNENEVLFLEAGGLPCTVDPELPMPIRGVREIAYRTQKSAYNNNFMESKWAKFLPKGHVDMQNVLFAPLNLEGKTVGIIGLANKPSDFTEDDAEIAASFGELAAIALLKSRQMDQLEEKTKSLEKALEEVKTLHGLIPMCMSCKSIRNDKGYWTKVESYLTQNAEVKVSHALCPDCLRKIYPELAEEVLGELEAS